MKLTREITQNDADVKSYTFSLCSDEPYERSNKEFGTYDEVLVISEDSIDFSRLNSGSCAFLKDHDMDEVLGVITKAWIEGNKVKCTVKFSERQEVQGYVKDVEQGIMTCTSIGYEVQDYHFEQINGKKTMFVDKFLIYEGSLVGVPADMTVGFNRSIEVGDNIPMKKEEMTETTEEVVAENTPTEEVKECGAECEQPKEEVKECSTEETKPTEEVKECSTDTATEEEVKECGKKECDGECEGECDAEEIRSLGELTDNKELAETFINEHRSYEEFKKEIKTKKDTKLNIKEEKKMSFNLCKALNMCTKKYTGEVENTDEFKISEEYKSKFGVNDADIVITRNELRAFPDGSEALNQTLYRPDMYTENLRPQNVIAKTGCKVVNVDGKSISFAVATSGINAGFVDLNGEIPSADMTWIQKTIEPKKLGAYVQIDYKALLQDDPNIRAIITDDIVKGLDQAKDEAMLCGDGTNNKPTGITATSGINEVPVSGVFSLSGVQEMEKLIRDSNDFTDDLKFVMNSTNYYKFARTPLSATEQNEFILDRQTGKILRHDVFICNKLNDNQIILGNFNELLCANYDGLRLKVVEDASLSRKQAIEIQAFEAFNCLVRRPKSFTVTKA